MGSGSSLRPLVVEQASDPSPDEPRLFAPLGRAWPRTARALSWLSLGCLAMVEPLSRAEPSQLTPSACVVKQQSPLFVGFAEDADLASFEDTAIASKALLRGVKGWACGAPPGDATVVPSLRLALASSAGVRIARVQFEVSDLTRGYVVLDVPDGPAGSLAAASRWQVDMARQDDASWTVSRTSVMRSSPEPR